MSGLAARKFQNSEFRIQNSENSVANHSAFCILNSAFPALLHARDPRRGDLVVACNQAAMERGVRLRMPLAEAAALVNRVGCAHQSTEYGGQSPPYIWPHDPTADLTALARLAEQCERFSPIVGWDTVQGSKFKAQSSKSKDQTSLTSNLELGTLNFCGPDCLFLDVTGIGVLFGGEEMLAAEVIADMSRLNYTARTAIADTIGAAWALARADSSKFKVQSSRFHVREESTLNVELGTLSLDSLRLPQETLDLLSELGIVRLEQLLALPRESLRARFGELLLLRIDQLVGTAQEMIVPHRQTPQFIEEWLLEYPAERREIIEQIVCELVRRIAGGLASRREGAVRLHCRFDCAPGRPVCFEVGLFRPSADAEHLWELVRMQLEQASLPGAVGRVRIEAKITAPLENRQGELFAGGEHEAARQFALLIDRCSSRLGPDKVLCPQLTADPLPERAVRYKRGVRGQGAGDRKFKVGVPAKRVYSKFKVSGKQNTTLNLEPGTLNSSPHSALLRPLILHSPPLLIATVSIAPDGPPVSFQLQGRRYDVAYRSGPERIETGWWRGKSVRRNYWRVETTTGQRFWLFRQLADGQWYLHGEYA